MFLKRMAYDMTRHVHCTAYTNLSGVIVEPVVNIMMTRVTDRADNTPVTRMHFHGPGLSMPQ